MTTRGLQFWPPPMWRLLFFIRQWGFSKHSPVTPCSPWPFLLGTVRTLKGNSRFVAILLSEAVHCMIVFGLGIVMIQASFILLTTLATILALPTSSDVMCSGPLTTQISECRRPLTSMLRILNAPILRQIQFLTPSSGCYSIATPQS